MAIGFQYNDSMIMTIVCPRREFCVDLTCARRLRRKLLVASLGKLTQPAQAWNLPNLLA